MTSATEIRAAIRRVADQLQAEGLVPTRRLVGERLGRGSPNTIVKELRAWKESQAAANEASSPSATPAPQATNVQELVATLTQVLQEVSSLRTVAHDTTAGLQSVADTLAQSLGAWDGLTRQFETDRAALREELSKLNDRFEGVQRRMLLSIDEAREETRRWKEIAQAARDELGTWRIAMQQRIEQLTSENGRLKGQVEMTRGER